MCPVSALYVSLCLPLTCPDMLLLCVQASDQELDGGHLGGPQPQDLGPRRARGSKSNLLQGVGRQSSAVNLTTLARDSDLKRLVEEVVLHGTSYLCFSIYICLMASSCLLLDNSLQGQSPPSGLLLPLLSLMLLLLSLMLLLLLACCTQWLL